MSGKAEMRVGIPSAHGWIYWAGFQDGRQAEWKRGHRDGLIWFFAYNRRVFGFVLGCALAAPVMVIALAVTCANS